MQNSSQNIHNSIFTTITNTYIYLFTIIIPLIITNGYINIVETKYITFIILSVVMFIALLIAGLMDSDNILEKILSAFSINVCDIAIILWYITITISSLLSINRRISIMGEAGWYTGWILYSTIALVYFCIRLFSKVNYTMVNCLCISNIITSTLGILDIYNIHIIPIAERNSNFLSTLGNVDWICGYLSLAVPILLGYTIFCSKYRILAGLSLLVTLTFAIVQPAESAYIAIIISLIAYSLLQLKNKKTSSIFIALCLFAVILPALPLIASYTRFDMNWGNGRGASAYITYSILKSFNLRELLIGVGPDCFFSCICTNPELLALMNSYFTLPLTNAHIEPLTLLVNTGFIGTIAYYSIFIMHILLIKKEDSSFDSPSFIIHIITNVTAVCYLLHNLVSFQQILNLPLVFIILGMCNINKIST